MFKKFIPTLLSIGSAVLVAVSPSISHALAGFAGAHPTAAAAITAAFGIFAHLWPSPIASKQ